MTEAKLRIAPADIALHALGALLALPFLVAEHSPPFPGFHAEWLACVLGLLAALALAADRGTLLRLPGIALLPAVLIGILSLQAMLGLHAYVEVPLLGALYLTWAIVVMTVAASLNDRIGTERVVDTLAFWLLAGALADALAGLVGLAGMQSSWLMPQYRAPILYGNLGQTNQFAHHLWLGVASALYLANRRRLPLPLLVAALAPLLPAAALSGSRAALLYAIWLMLVAFGWRARGAVRRAAASAACFAVIVVALPLAGVDESKLAAGRLVDDYTAHVDRLGGTERSSIDARLSMLSIAGHMALQAPWLGTGFGSYAWESFAAAARPNWNGGGEHAHNLFAQILGEMGAPALVACFGFMLLWWIALARRRQLAANAWLAAVAGIVLIHSQLEYPLWYAYFLGLCAVALAIGDARGVTLHRRTMLPVAALAGLVVAGMLFADYRRFQTLVPTPGLHASAQAQRHAALLALRQGSLLKPEIDLLYAATMLPTRERAADKRVLCELSLRYHPSNPTVYICASLLALDGNEAQARALWQLAERVSPGSGKAFRERYRRELAPADWAELEPRLARIAAGSR